MVIILKLKKIPFFHLPILTNLKKKIIICKMKKVKKKIILPYQTLFNYFEDSTRHLSTNFAYE